MPHSDGIYICPVCRKQYYGDLAGRLACNGVREVQHQPVMVEQTHNRPRVSNDNPFSESEFRTMKYRPNYPGVFNDLDTARAWAEFTDPAEPGQRLRVEISLESVSWYLPSTSVTRTSTIG